ncbi:PLAT/LH2 domain superfamily [Sesbania bispinosa]|nr:PLAT/LH2 domain superfamily [Sesbania bispinosa]
MLKNIVNALSTSDSDDNKSKSHRIRGTVILMKKNVLDFNDLGASILDRLHEFVGKGVSIQLISAVKVDTGQYTISSLLVLSYVLISSYIPLSLCVSVMVFA